ncbi:MAG TPA: DUF3500 domain-containing protein [Pirellulales bacterium]|jgi:hypothetical protein|nr:DUF3500 domain-containing protein [Pirellulales bacterium]
MDIAVSGPSVAAGIVTKKLGGPTSNRTCAIGPWLGCLAAILATIGCSRTGDLRGETDAAAARQQPGDEQAADGQSLPVESEEADLLAPDNIPIPDLDTEEKRKGKGIPESVIIVDFGGTVRSFAADFPFPVVKEQGEWVILLGQEGSKLWVSARFYNDAGQMVCEIEKNQLRTNDQNAYRIERTPHALTVFDQEAKKVFAIHFLNDRAVRLFGDFYSREGCHVVINESGVEFGHDRSFSNTGLNGVSLVLDPPSQALTRTEPPAMKKEGTEDRAPREAGSDTPDTAETAGSDVGTAMTESAQAFVASLSPDELAKATMKFDDPARLDWTNIPKKERKGLPLREMTPEQKVLCHNLLRAALSRSGYDKASKIMSLENNLREGEKNLNTGWARNPEDYYLTIFGQPAAGDTWGWGFEGHHLSLNFVVREGKVVSETPSFWGANPATVRIYVPGGPEEGTRTLSSEEQLAFDLVGQLSDGQRDKAMIAETAPAEYRAVGTPQPPHTAPEGLPAAEMSEPEKKSLRSLLEVYASHLAPQLAAAQLADIDARGFDRIYFAWAGATAPGKGHYYRIQGPSFVLELVNIQSDPAGNLANHIHSVWRSLDGDFGVAGN